jgi:2-iminobutanoate/2-iminopropanoate deaminase
MHLDGTIEILPIQIERARRPARSRSLAKSPSGCDPGYPARRHAVWIRKSILYLPAKKRAEAQLHLSAWPGWEESRRSRKRRKTMKREIIRVEPFDSNFEKWGAPVSTCTRAGDLIFISGMPPFDPKTGEILVNAPFEQQAERVLEQLRMALEAAGSDLDHVMKINVLCVNPERFKAFNEIYKRYFPKHPPARIFFCVPVWTGPFDIEIDCIAVRKD